ncbi:TPA: phage tail fiber protein, partial [Acinetobacter baumannii]
RTPDGYIVVADVGGNWEKITVAFPTVDDFGGLGDDPNYDDADAFIRCALSPYTGSNIYLANRQVEYRINKQVDCKGKGIVGGGFSRQNATAYAMNSLKVRPGDYSNSNTLLNNVAFINVGAEVRDLQLVSEGVSENISGLKVDGYNFTLSNANISGFYNQVYLSNATVSFRVQNLMSISAANAGFFIADVDSRQSTTAYFDNCSWQWGKYPVLFAKEAYQCVFNNIILEYMQYGLTAGIWSNCSFNAIWAEQTRDGVARDWLVNTSYQQTFNCTVNNLYIRTPWLNRADPTALGASDNIGGVVIDKSRITLGGATGAKIQLSPSGLATLFANWYGG